MLGIKVLYAYIMPSMYILCMHILPLHTFWELKGCLLCLAMIKYVMYKYMPVQAQLN